MLFNELFIFHILFRVFFSKKRYSNIDIDKLYEIKDISKNGVIEYFDNYYGLVIKLGQKNFGIEDMEEQDIDIESQPTLPYLHK